MAITQFHNARPNEAPLPDPLAYFLTWPTYGTWLPGDERGWVKRSQGWRPPAPIRKRDAEQRMNERPCYLDPEQRSLIEKTIADHCRIRNWHLFIVQCRTNHVHIVVAANCHPEEVRDQFKAWCTRKLKELQRQKSCLIIRKHWWAERGSERYINDDTSLESAIQYVMDGQ